ncbi:MAG: glutathione peroxidase [Prevotellaceae bacterium]|jgi:glutathione peroxidase|nr:glutathione peroxidase [Prevotellaceae bacterium]
MRKLIKSAAVVLGVVALSSVSVAQPAKSFYDFKIETLDGRLMSLGELRGKKVMVVNTASKCAYTKQYADLQSLYERYRPQGFEVIGFPANNFKNEEPGTNEEIANFCSATYGVTFLMSNKIDVIGNEQHPLYRWLTTKAENGVMDSEVKWNFQKYLIDENGTLVGIAESKEKPDSNRIVEWIKSGVLKK